MKLHKAFANGSSADIKLLKIQLDRMGQSGGFLGRLLGPLLKPGLPLMEYVLKLLAESVLIPLGLTAEVSATDAAIHQKKICIWCAYFRLRKRKKSDWFLISYKNWIQLASIVDSSVITCDEVIEAITKTVLIN